MVECRSDISSRIETWARTTGAVESDKSRGDDLSSDGIADGTSPEQAAARASMKESLAFLTGVPEEQGME